MCCWRKVVRLELPCLQWTRSDQYIPSPCSAFRACGEREKFRFMIGSEVRAFAKAHAPDFYLSALLAPQAMQQHLIANNYPGILDGMTSMMEATGARQGKFGVKTKNAESIEALKHSLKNDRIEFESPRIPGRFRGTGCRLALKARSDRPSSAKLPECD